MAVLADYKGLASPFRHDRRPCRHTRRVRPVEEFFEVRELSDMVHLNVSRALADLASVRKESGDQFLGTDRSTWLMVPQDGLLLRAEWYSSVPGNQWFPPTSAFDPRFEARAQPVWGVDFGLVFRRRLAYGRAVLAAEGLQHRRLHDPVQSIQPVDVAGQQVVLDYPTIFRPIDGDDGVVVHIHYLGAARGLSALHIVGAFGLDHVGWHPQPNGPVTRPLAVGDRLVVLPNGDLVVEESCRAGAGMSDQRFLFRQFQPEFITQELSESLL